MKEYQKEQFRNVYFISGTACGGKSSVARELGRQYGLYVYDIDQHFGEHRARSNPMNQPNMNKSFSSADAFFGRSKEEYTGWLIGNRDEQMPFILEDLAELSRDRIVLCDCHITPHMAEPITTPDHVAYLLREPENIVEDYCNRYDHTDFKDFIESASDAASAKEKVNAVFFGLNAPFIEDVKKSGYFHLFRDNSRCIFDTARLVARHFGLDGKDGITFREVEKGTELAEKWLRFVKDFSWEEAKAHLVWMIENWTFSDWEKVFVAIKDDEIIAMAAVLKTDYYPLPEICPWVSCVFTSEEYRGRHLSGRLIEMANRYAKSLGFDTTFIPCEHFGLYEKYGYTFVRDIVNYGGGTDRLFRKDI